MTGKPAALVTVDMEVSSDIEGTRRILERRQYVYIGIPLGEVRHFIDRLALKRVSHVEIEEIVYHG